MVQKIIRKEIRVPEEPKVPETIEEFCIGCNICVKVCPMKNINLSVKKELSKGIFLMIAETSLLGRKESAEFCIRCRKCVEECPADARTF